MEGKTWVKWTVTFEPSRDQELILSWLSDLSPRGLWEIDEQTVVAYFDEAPRKTQLPDGVISLKKEIELDRCWAETWRSFFRPIRLGRRIVVRPPWEKSVPDTVDVVIYPAYAFGTGDHPTTALCLTHLERYLRPGLDVLDIGSGSGILAILAAKLQAGKIVTLDNDRLAITEIRRNMALNELGKERIEYRLTELADLTGSFDLIVANIGLKYHLDQLPAMFERLRDGGRLILSGFEVEDTARLAEKARTIGLTEEARQIATGWSSLVYNKKGSGS
ncbi:MAG TPA: 50S ribosomal protein L11 methyltransferase [Atribacteraceae bacterium]|nr:50S ribosomal protein L11 methyltransferase [Atribacteraceae bacterium]